MIIDAHVHLYKRTKKELLKQLKKANISKALVLDYFDKNDKYLGYQRQELIEIVKKENKLELAGSFDIIKNDKKDFKNLEKHLKNKDYKAIKLYPGYQHFFPYEIKCNKIYRLCLEHDVPIIFHLGTLGENDGSSLLEYAKPLSLDRVAVKFPELKIVMAHFGCPFFDEAAAVLERHENVFADLSGIVDAPYNKEETKHVRNRLNFTIEFVGSEKLMFGSDCDVSCEKISDYVNFIKWLDLSKEDKELIFYKNAKEFYKL